MATIKVFHRTDAPADGNADVSRHMPIEKFVDNYEYAGRTNMALTDSPEDSTFGSRHAANAFNEAIDRFTHGPGAHKSFLKREVRGLRPGDILVRSDTGEAVILRKDGYEVLDLKDVIGRVDKASEGSHTDPDTFPGYDPGSNEKWDPDEHTYDDFEGTIPQDNSFTGSSE